MKKLILISLILLSLYSCRSTYYYSTLSSDNGYVENVENGDFLLDTDSLWIAYCFKGLGAPVQVTVFNKSNKALYVDWSRSALIIDGMAMTYAGKQLNYDDFMDMATKSDIYNVTRLSENASYIAPQSMVSEIPLSLYPNFEKINKKLYKKAYMGDKANNKTQISRIDYNINNSPLMFKSYLTLYRVPHRPIVFQQDFYMSNLIKTHSISPDKLPMGMIDKGDFFYVEKHPNTGLIEGVLGVSLIVGVVALDVITSDYD